MTEPPHEWLALPDHQRDLLTTLDVDGPGSGSGLYRRVGNEVSRPTTHSNLKRLEDSGLVAVSPKNGRENTYEITEEGRRVLEEAREWMARDYRRDD